MIHSLEGRIALFCVDLAHMYNTFESLKNSHALEKFLASTTQSDP